MTAGLVGCSGNGQGLDQGGRPLTSGGTGGGVLTADFDSIQRNVFTPICTTCHAGSNAPQGLHLDAANSYSQLVGVASVEVPALLRVKPGDPGSSYIVQKLEGHAAVGAQMPFGGPPLPTATIAVIRQWISDGALPSSVAAGIGTRFAALSVVPAAGDLLDTPPARIVIAFSQELDQTQIDASSVHLEATPSDERGPVEILPASASVPVGNPRTLIVQPAAALTGGRHYRVVVGGVTRSALSSVGGDRLLGAAIDDGGVTVLTEFDVAVAP
ncbi:MAG: hypothetical protein WCD08_02055 [Steroidobacteraceae bacterium]